MSEMRRLINLSESLFRSGVDESLDQSVELEYHSVASPGSGYHRLIYSDLELPDSTVLRIQAGLRVQWNLGKKNQDVRLPSYWEVGFGRTGSPTADLEDPDSWKDDLTRQGSERLVFSAVLEFMRHLVTTKKPREIRFGTSNAGGAADKRASTYGRIAARYAPSLGYDVTTQPDPKIAGGTLFILSRQD